MNKKLKRELEELADQIDDHIEKQRAAYRAANAHEEASSVLWRRIDQLPEEERNYLQQYRCRKGGQR